MSRRGSSLVAILLLAALLGFIQLQLLEYGIQSRERVARLSYEVQAEAMARSGLRYAEAMIAHRRWQGPTRYASPALGRGERFHVTTRPVPGGWELESVGEVGAVQRTRRERI